MSEEHLALLLLGLMIGILLAGMVGFACVIRLQGNHRRSRMAEERQAAEAQMADVGQAAVARMLNLAAGHAGDQVAVFAESPQHAGEPARRNVGNSLD